MEGSNFRYFYDIYCKKIILSGVAVLCTMNAFGQALNKPFYDYDRVIHFGFTIGMNYSTLKYDFNPNVWPNKQKPNDTILGVSSQGAAGITLGAVADLHLGPTKSFWREHFDLRFIPSLVLSERDLLYKMHDSSINTKKIESAFVEFPFLLKLKSDRVGNLRFYIIGGGEYSYDLSSTANALVDPANPKVSVYPNNIAYQFGAGLDMYFPDRKSTRL